MPVLLQQQRPTKQVSGAETEQELARAAPSQHTTCLKKRYCLKLYEEREASQLGSERGRQRHKRAGERDKKGNRGRAERGRSRPRKNEAETELEGGTEREQMGQLRQTERG